MKKSKYIKGILIAALSVVFLVFTGCAVASLMTEWGHVKGIATDSVTGEPIDGVYVGAYSNDYYYDYNDWSEDYDYTDGGGSYDLRLSTGDYDIYYEKDGYRDVRLYDINVIAPFTQSRDIEMEPDNPTPTPTLMDKLYVTRTGNTNLYDVFYVERETGRMNVDANSPIATGQGPAGILYLSGKTMLCVANSLENSVSAYSSIGPYTQVSGSPFKLASTDGTAYKLAFDSTLNKVFISLKSSSSPGKIEYLNVIDGNNVNVGGLINAPDLADDPQDIIAHSSNSILYIASRAGNMITTYNTSADSVSGTFSITDPVAISFYESGSRLYVVSGSTKTLTTLDVANPTAITKVEPDMIITTDAGRTVIDCEVAPDKSLLFTLEGGPTGYYIRSWNIASGPPFTEIQAELSLGTTSVSSIYYSQIGNYLFAAHDGAAMDGIRVFDVGNYPSSGINEVPDSPFSGGAQYYMMDM
ncbi:MAG: hypothetical protein K8T10_20845 [Candidatus Eremiobacteraeota bacterium]|nr:hypothetical protein [Candidatus Eremiobacteraeota bacterium]